MDARTTRRDALRLGGVTLSLGAIIAACGDGRGGDDAPGRVGLAPSTTALGDFAVDDVALLRTASSLEITAVELYNTALDLDVLPSAAVTLANRLIDNHQAVADEMAALTEAAGGEAWTCNNPWIVERSIEPILASIIESDDVLRDVINLAISFENLAVATHQSLARALTTSERRVAVANAASLEARHSAALVIETGGPEGYLSPALIGEDVDRNVDGTIPNFAINSQFGSVGQIELVVGVPDENGTRETFVLQTPAENAFVYSELESTC